MNHSKPQMTLIGAAVNPIDSGLNDILEAGVTRDHFTGVCKNAWVEIEKVFASGTPVTYMSLSERKIIGADSEFLDNCLDMYVSPQFTPDAVATVKRESMLRRGAELLQDSAELLEGAISDDAESIISLIQTRWLSLRITEEEQIPLHERMLEFIKQCDEGTAGVVPWFLPKIQKRYGKLTEEFIVIHAKPSIGKTAMVIQWMTFLRRHGYVPALASLESSIRSIAPRFISHIAQVNSLLMKTGNSSPGTMVRALESAKTAEKLDYIIKDGRMNDAQLMAWCRIQKENGVQIIFIDNLRHIESTESYDSEMKKFMEISLAVKRIRDELHIPVVLLHHSNEDGDLGWCKDIKKDADVVIQLDRVEEQDPEDGIDNVDYVFQKGRDAGEFTIRTSFNKTIQTYDDGSPVEKPKEQEELI